MTLRRVFQLLFKYIKPLIKQKKLVGLMLLFILFQGLSNSDLLKGAGKFYSPYEYKEESFQQAIVTKVIDSTTFECKVGEQSIVIKLISLKDPGQEFESIREEAVQYIQGLVFEKPVYLEKDIKEVDASGIPVRYVWLEKPNQVIKDQLVRDNLLNSLIAEKGFADVITHFPNEKYEHIILAKKLQAREKREGFWKLTLN